MKQLSQPWGYVNERILREKLNNLDREGILRRIEPNIFSFDGFDKEGEIIDGGMIDLENMDVSVKNRLLNNINQKQEISIFDNRGNVDYNKINPLILIDEYKKIKQ